MQPQFVPPTCRAMHFSCFPGALLQICLAMSYAVSAEFRCTLFSSCFSFCSVAEKEEEQKRRNLGAKGAPWGFTSMASADRQDTGNAGRKSRRDVIWEPKGPHGVLRPWRVQIG